MSRISRDELMQHARDARRHFTEHMTLRHEPEISYVVSYFLPEEGEEWLTFYWDRNDSNAAHNITTGPVLRGLAASRDTTRAILQAKHGL